METCSICGKLRDTKKVYTNHKICTSCVIDFRNAFVNEDKENPIRNFPDFNNIVSWLRVKTFDEIINIIEI